MRQVKGEYINIYSAPEKNIALLQKTSFLWQKYSLSMNKIFISVLHDTDMLSNTW
jgi:hypothetical protein